jgi:ABC-type lipoprotein release transport system permease subunit
VGTTARIAWRNLGRNRRRTAVTASAIAVGVALCVATYGLTDGLNDQLVDTVTRLELGHVQLHEPEYPKRRALRYAIPDPAAVLAATDALPEARGAAPRAFAWALASKGDTSTGVELVGIDPPRERTVTAFLEKVTEGAPLPDAPTPWPSGREPTAEELAWDRRVTERETAAALDELDALPSLGEGGAPPAPAPAAADAPGPAAGPDRTADRPAAEPGALRDQTLELVRDLSPPPAEPPPILLGERLARSLRAGVGDPVWLLTSTRDGRTAEEQFRVAGLYRTGGATMDRMRAYVHLADLQRFVRLGSAVHEIAVRAPDPEEAAPLASALLARPETDGLLVRGWYDVKPMLKRMLDLNDASVGILLFIIFTVAALGVLNTMLMAVFERTRELGVLMALGLRPGQVRGLVVVETVLLTLLGGVVGTAIGLGLDAYLMVYGWDLRSFTGGFSIAGVGVDPVLRAAIEVRGVLVPLLAISIVTFLASFYPAHRASKLSPTEAMRTA